MTITPQTITIGTHWKNVCDPFVFQLEDNERDLFGNCDFLPKDLIMQRLLEWKPILGLVSINILLYNFDGKPTHKRSKMFVLPKGEEPIFTELANLSDVHGLVAMYSGSLWLARTSDTSELNIDADVMNRFQEILKVASKEEEQRMIEEAQRKIILSSLYGFGDIGK